MKTFIYSVFLLLLLHGATACSNEAAEENNKTQSSTEDTSTGAENAIQETKFAIKSPSFSDEDTIPVVYTCDGKDISPALTWSGSPTGTRSMALICEDPDVENGSFIHWVIYNIQPEMSLTEDFPTKAKMDNGILQGKNGAGKTGYKGPCPPSGSHRYYFRLYALDNMLDLDPGKANEATLKDAMQGHILSEAMIMGIYSRKK